MSSVLTILAPLVRELRSDSTAELFFVNGPVPAYPPEGFEEFFGVGPYYRFMKPSASEEASGGDVLDRIRNFPKGATAEDQMRELMRGGAATVLPEGNVNNSAAEAMEYLYHIMEEDGPFDGIIGYSEGATVAGSKRSFQMCRTIGTATTAESCSSLVKANISQHCYYTNSVVPKCLLLSQCSSLPASLLDGRH